MFFRGFRGKNSYGPATEFLEELERAVQIPRYKMADGSYQFSNASLSIVKIVETQNEQILPCSSLLLKINETCINGLDAGDGDQCCRNSRVLAAARPGSHPWQAALVLMPVNQSWFDQ